MAYDPDHFRRAYLEEPLPIDLGEGWSLHEVASDRLRSAINLRLRSAEGGALTLFVERALEGTVCFGRTAELAVSYYAEKGIDDAAAARVTQRVLDRLRRSEAKQQNAEGALKIGASKTTHATRTLELRINRECNERCLFCNTPESSDAILSGPAAIYDAIARERTAGYEDVTFTGREPTLDDELPSYLRAAREAGYRTIRVQTNGTSFAHEPLLERLIDAGMNTTEISLHTIDAKTFRRLIGPPRLLDKTLEGLANLDKHPDVTVHIVCVLTRSNLDQLEAVLERLVRTHRRIAQITVSPMAPVGDGAVHLDLVPRLSELREPLQKLFEQAHRRALNVVIPSRCGAPLCAMPNGMERFNAELANVPGQTLEPSKAKSQPCRSCAHDPICTGVWRAYLERYGDSELRPA